MTWKIVCNVVYKSKCYIHKFIFAKNLLCELVENMEKHVIVDLLMPFDYINTSSNKPLPFMSARATKKPFVDFFYIGTDQISGYFILFLPIFSKSMLNYMPRLMITEKIIWGKR